MFSKKLNTLIATLLTMATLQQATGLVDGLFNVNSLLNYNVNLDFEGDLELEDNEKEEDKITSKSIPSRLINFDVESLAYQIFYSNSHYLEIPSPPPDKL